MKVYGNSKGESWSNQNSIEQGRTKKPKRLTLHTLWRKRKDVEFNTNKHWLEIYFQNKPIGESKQYLKFPLIGSLKLLQPHPSFMWNNNSIIPEFDAQYKVNAPRLSNMLRNPLPNNLYLAHYEREIIYFEIDVNNI